MKRLGLSIVSVLCIGALWAFLVRIYTDLMWKIFRHIVFITTFKAGIPYLISGLCCFIYIRRRKKIQKLSFPKYDIIVTFSVIAFMTVLFFAIHSLPIRLVYTNIDLANHFQSAMYVFEEGHIGNMHFTAYHHAMILRMLSVFCSGAELYRAFFIADALMTGLGYLFFVWMLLPKAPKKFLPAAFLLFACGIPLYSYAVGGFCYWGVGAMLSLYCFMLYGEWKKSGKRLFAILTLLGVISVVFAYYLFLPPVVLGLMFCLVGDLYRKEELSKKRIFALAGCAALMMLILAVALRRYFHGSTELLRRYLSDDGMIFNKIWIDFLIPLPFAGYGIYREWKGRKETPFSIETAGLAASFLYALGFKILSLGGIASDYYFNKTLYPLWIFVFILAVRYAKDALSERKKVFLPVIIAAFFVLLYGNLFSKEKAGAYYESFRGVFGEKRICDEEKVKLFNSAYLIGERYNKPIVFIADNDIYSECLDRAWYDALTGNYSGNSYGWESDLPLILETLMDKETEYCIILKDSENFRRYPELINAFEMEAYNEAGYILRIRQKG
ncbi:MAG: hypothetical protein K6F53_03800 [Lachnospiraceae bacterium]|nr:hypothetical protein [Lachnospiraceae bacterium]